MQGNRKNSLAVPAIAQQGQTQGLKNCTSKEPICKQYTLRIYLVLGRPEAGWEC